MNNEEKATELSEKLYSGCKDYIGKRDLFSYLMSMAQWKDEQYQEKIKESKELYKEIDNCISQLIKARVEHDEVLERIELSIMEKIMVEAQQFLAYINEL